MKSSFSRPSPVIFASASPSSVSIRGARSRKSGMAASSSRETQRKASDSFRSIITRSSSPSNRKTNRMSWCVCSASFFAAQAGCNASPCPAAAPFRRKRQRRQLFAADARLFGNLAVGGVQHRVVRRFDVSAGFATICRGWRCLSSSTRRLARLTITPPAVIWPAKFLRSYSDSPVEPGDEFRERPSFRLFLRKMPEIAFFVNAGCLCADPFGEGLFVQFILAVLTSREFGPMQTLNSPGSQTCSSSLL